MPTKAGGSVAELYGALERGAEKLRDAESIGGRRARDVLLGELAVVKAGAPGSSYRAKQALKDARSYAQAALKSLEAGQGMAGERSLKDEIEAVTRAAKQEGETSESLRARRSDIDRAERARLEKLRLRSFLEDKVLVPAAKAAKNVATSAVGLGALLVLAAVAVFGLTSSRRS